MQRDGIRPEPIIVRHDLRAGDIGAIVQMHGVTYQRERGWDISFEAYVAGPLSDFIRSASQRERLWIAEQAMQIVGCVAIVAVSTETAQLRWFLVRPDVRGAGLGERLLRQALGFARDAGYADVVLWTEKSLEAAARLYERVGFRKTEESPPEELWGAKVIQEKYELDLT